MYRQEDGSEPDVASILQRGITFIATAQRVTPVDTAR